MTVLSPVDVLVVGTLLSLQNVIAHCHVPLMVTREGGWGIRLRVHTFTKCQV